MRNLLYLPMDKVVFNYYGHRQEYRVSFEIGDNESIFSDCSCSSRKPCKHIQNLLISRTEKLRDDQAHLLRDFIGRISKTEAGREAIRQARAYFQEETRCRRCNSEDIVDTKGNTFKSRVYRLLSRHRYYCKNCKWSW